MGKDGEEKDKIFTMRKIVFIDKIQKNTTALYLLLMISLRGMTQFILPIQFPIHMKDF